MIKKALTGGWAMISDIRVFTLIVTMAVVTIAIRFAPFVLLKGKETPNFVNYLGKVLPYSIMAMLVVYCLKGISFLNRPYGMPEIIATLVVAGLHVWKRNTLLSIVTGTLVYMLLKQMVFI